MGARHTSMGRTTWCGAASQQISMVDKCGAAYQRTWWRLVILPVPIRITSQSPVWIPLTMPKLGVCVPGRFCGFCWFAVCGPMPPSPRHGSANHSNQPTTKRNHCTGNKTRSTIGHYPPTYRDTGLVGPRPWVASWEHVLEAVASCTIQRPAAW